MSDLQEQLQQEIEAHNQVHNQVQAGEEQLQALKQERDRRYGRITVLQELIQGQENKITVAEESDEAPEA